MVKSPPLKKACSRHIPKSAPAGSRARVDSPDSMPPSWPARVLAHIQKKMRAPLRTNMESRLPKPFTFFLGAPWMRFWVCMLLVYLTIVLVFALLFCTEKDGLMVRGGDEMRLSDCFFFSVQTFTTIGYGAIYPQTVLSDVLVTIESFVGTAFMTMGSGLLFVRVSRPKPHIAFSGVVVVAGSPPVLSVRVVNLRPGTRLLDTTVRLSVLTESDDPTIADFHGKALVRLKLVRDWSASFAFPWTLRHVLNEDSPLFGLTEENAKTKLVFVEAFISGTDESYLQQVYTMHVFYPKDVQFQRKFANIVHFDETGTLIDLDKLNDTDKWVAPMEDDAATVAQRSEHKLWRMGIGAMALEHRDKRRTSEKRLGKCFRAIKSMNNLHNRSMRTVAPLNLKTVDNTSQPKYVVDSGDSGEAGTSGTADADAVVEVEAGCDDAKRSP